MLTAEQVPQYRRDGYTLCEEFLRKQEVTTLLTEIEQVCKGNTLAHQDFARLDTEPNQASDGTGSSRKQVGYWIVLSSCRGLISSSTTAKST